LAKRLRNPGGLIGRPRAPGESFEAARRRKESALADLRQLEFRRRKGELVELSVAERTVAAFIRELRSLILEQPALECDALAEAFTQDPTPAGVKREHERANRDLLERMSQRAFTLAEEQPA